MKVTGFIRVILIFFVMATTTNSYQLSILYGCIVTTKTPQEASQLLAVAKPQSNCFCIAAYMHQLAIPETVLLPHICVYRYIIG